MDNINVLQQYEALSAAGMTKADLEKEDSDDEGDFDAAESPDGEP